MAQSDFMLELRQVSRRYGGDSVVQALSEINLQVAAGEWLAITGPSGSGKSTLLNILGCLDRPTSGSYHFGGVDTATLSDWQRAGLRSRHIGFVFQSFHLLPHRSVLENVMLAEVYRKQRRRGRRQRALAALERVGLRHRIDFLPTTLSGGERQRVAIARSLVDSPSLLLCDEPTGNLDSTSTNTILDLLAKLNAQGLTLLVVTHDEHVAGRARRRVHMVDGALVEETAPAPPVPPASVGESVKRAGKITPSGMSLWDLLDEAVAGLLARPGRMVLTLLGVMIGLTALVATLGISRTASNRIISQFDELAATEVVVTAQAAALEKSPHVIPWDAAVRLNRLNGVVAAGTLSEVSIGDALISALPVQDPQRQTAFKLSVQAASPGLFAAVRAVLAQGRLLDEGHAARANRVAVLGAGAAQRLGIREIAHYPAIAIGDQLYAVIGILRTVARQPDLLGAVIIPEATAQRDFGLAGPGLVIVETRIGATSLIVEQTPLALRPDDPSALKIEFPPEPQRVRDAVQSDLNVMFLLFGALSLVVGAIGIGNMTLVSVLERVGEIGLRRAMGATRTHIAAQFLLESATLGVVGGILGGSVGVLIVVVVAAYQLWTPVLEPGVPLAAPLLGGVIGLLSGVYPALRAAQLEPVEAFRN